MWRPIFHWLLKLIINTGIFTGLATVQQRLKPTAVPSLFKWARLQSPAQQKREHRMTARCNNRQKLDETVQESLEGDLHQPFQCNEVTVETEQSETTPEPFMLYIPAFHDDVTDSTTAYVLNQKI